MERTQYVTPLRADGIRRLGRESGEELERTNSPTCPAFL